ncbi:XTP/dITP diphosphatase [Alkalicoccus chagannorensis]|uniref:XTP/dITP diphosphatase n=1 Tax=Alkalicoccus chagannorensis TaxID=427072 RepID=UPI0003FE9FA5|nr:XTP/dITP diphosphatase [Alkalicoccus chagannorensis]
MPRDLFIASNNAGKMKEFKAFFEPKGFTVKSLSDLPEEVDVVEDGTTFEENAAKKAEEIGRKFDIPVLADDSGLEVDALDGAPGVYSARFAGEQKEDSANNALLLEKMSGIEDRRARFVCVLALSFPGEDTILVRGTVEGEIAQSLRGTEGFGYDPLFYLPDRNKVMAELERDEKNDISHRADALKKLSNVWTNWKEADE